MFVKMFKMPLKCIYIYAYAPHRAIFRKHIIKESIALRSLLIVLLKYVVVIINFGFITCYSYYVTEKLIAIFVISL
jgi:hypothetical protein